MASTKPSTKRARSAAAALKKLRSGSLKDRLEARDLARLQGGRPSDKDFKTAVIKKLQGSKPSSGRKALIKKVKKAQASKPSSPSRKSQGAKPSSPSRKRKKK
jgi:hypothetical protein